MVQETKWKISVVLMPLSVALLSFLHIAGYTFNYTQASSIWPWSVTNHVELAPPALDILNYKCTHNYSVEILSIDPFIMYINGFVKPEEADHLVRSASDRFERSWVYDDNLGTVVDTRYRTSKSAMISQKDVVAECLSQRMKGLLGNMQHIDTEPIQVVKYEGGEKYSVHVDWSETPLNRTFNPDRPYRSYNRLGTVFAYLEDDCTGGETYFPDIKGVAPTADGSKYSRTDTGMGLLVKPRKGNAVFWNNLHPDGSGDVRVAHAGLPVTSGTKIGINLFSWYYFDSPMFGGDE